jgi:hypothetical protein
MFLGHYGLAFALKRAEPKVSLGAWFVAVQLLDLLWGSFLVLGWEHARIVADPAAVTPFEFWDYPISHSMVGASAWGIVAAACYYSWPTRDTTRHWQAATLVGVAVFSHYLLDLVVHLPDLPLLGNDSPKLGFGLWRHPIATMLVELATLGLGVAVYVALRSKRYPVRPVRLAVLLLLLLSTYFASVYGPLPPNMSTVGISAILIILLAGLLAAWVDRRRTPEELQAQHLGER